MAELNIKTAMTEGESAMDAIRSAVDNEKPKAALHDELDTLDSTAWKDRGEELEAESSILEQAVELVNEYVEVAERLAEMYSSSMFFPQSVLDALEDQFLVLADEEQLGTWSVQAGEMQEKAEDLTTLAETATNFADAIDAAVEALDEWESAEGREDKADARESLLEALGELVENWDLVTDAFTGFDDGEEDQ